MVNVIHGGYGGVEHPIKLSSQPFKVARNQFEQRKELLTAQQANLWLALAIFGSLLPSVLSLPAVLLSFSRISLFYCEFKSFKCVACAVYGISIST